MEDLSNYRKSYEKSELLETAIPKNPFDLFKLWFQEVETSGGTEEVNAMTLSTIGLDGFPRARVVLLKKYTEEGFVFYTNYKSDKGKGIEENPNVCLSFFWQAMERQVIIKGIAQKVPEFTSDSYFNSRPNGSKLGAIASNQSEVVPSRGYLEDKLKQVEEKFEGVLIPRPEHWGGYIVKPIEVEFWQGRANRLHDRIRFIRQSDTNWHNERLAP